MKSMSATSETELSDLFAQTEGERGEAKMMFFTRGEERVLDRHSCATKETEREEDEDDSHNSLPAKTAAASMR